MKKAALSFVFVSAAMCVAAVLCGFFLAGCEDGAGTSGLTVSPSSVTLSGTSNTVTFTVTSNSLRELSFPLVWTVQNSAMGRILESAGSTAVYFSHGVGGVNIVTAQDQYGAEGLATVTRQ